MGDHWRFLSALAVGDPEAVDVTIGVGAEGKLAIGQMKDCFGDAVRGQMVEMDAAGGLEADPEDLMLLRHGVGFAADGDGDRFIGEITDGDMLFGVTVLHEGGKLGHRLAAADRGDPGIFDHQGEVIAGFTMVENQFVLHLGVPSFLSLEGSRIR